MKNNTIPNLPFSVDDLNYGTQYLGLTTTGTYLFYDSSSNSVFKWNIKSGYLRRNGSGTFDGRNCLVTRKRIKPDELLHALDNYMKSYQRDLMARRLPATVY